MFYKNDWLKWYYDDSLYAERTLDSKKFYIKICLDNYNEYNLYNELGKNAQLIYDQTDKLNLFFSGGLNSQIILRVYHDLKMPLNIYILRYTKNYNSIEYNIAKKICEDLNVKYTTLDFDVDYFFENEAYSILCNNPSHDPIKMIFLHAVTKIDGVSIVGNKFPYVYRTTLDYSQDANWKIKFCDEDFVYQRNYNKKKLIGDWFHYSPELFLSIIHTPALSYLVNNKFTGKNSSISSRKLIFDRYYYNLIDRSMSNGFDNFLLPSSMIFFFDNFIKDKIADLGTQDLCIDNFRSQIFL